MPVHRVANDDLERCVADIERSQREELVGSPQPAGDGAWVVFTKLTDRAKTGAKETRG